MSWPLKTLDKIFEIARGGSPRPIDQFITDADDGVNWIMIGDASNSSKHIRHTKKKIKPSGVSRSRLVKPGDFLLTNSMSFGRPYILDTHGCIHDGWLVLSPRQPNVDHDYFYHLLGSPAIFGQFEKLAAGATVKNLNIDLVKSVVVALPPLEEQKRIAAILDQADELRRKRKRALDRLNQLGQAIFIEMFGDPLGSTSQLPVVEFSDVVRRITYGFTSPMSHMESGIPIVTAKNVRDGWIDLDKVHYADRMEFDALTAKSKPAPGDILITKDGTIGRCAIVGNAPQLCINQSVALIQPRHDLVSSTYLLAYLMTPRVQQTFRGMKKGNAIAHLQITELARLPIPTPSLPEQAIFEAHMMTAAATKRRLEEAASKSDALFISLQNQAFHGELNASSLKEAAA